jgi:hypothetical protein
MLLCVEAKTKAGTELRENLLPEQANTPNEGNARQIVAKRQRWLV